MINATGVLLHTGLGRAPLITPEAPYETSGGYLDVVEAPLATASFVRLARRGFYDGLTFHRVIDDFMIQGGCPLGNGRGSPGFAFEDEINAGAFVTHAG